VNDPFAENVAVVDGDAALAQSAEALVGGGGVAVMVGHLLIEIAPGEAAEQILPLGDPAIDLGGKRVYDRVAADLREEIIDDAGEDGVGIIAKHLDRDRVEAVGGNGIGGERLALPSSVNGGWIVNDVGNLAEVAGFHSSSGKTER
jgi:hypothetical protein